LAEKHIETIGYKIKSASPQAVIYVHSGGYAAGKTLSGQLKLPLLPLDIRYPLSRFMSRFPLLAPLCWLIKEVVYRLTRPSLSPNGFHLPALHRSRSVVLVDDRVSSFRTMTRCLEALETAGIERTDVIIVTKRCSNKSRHLVDYVMEKDCP
jgi:adenine/guanine phosphoribosyltransferase-like PRPP-binding protein